MGYDEWAPLSSCLNGLPRGFLVIFLLRAEIFSKKRIRIAESNDDDLSIRTMDGDPMMLDREAFRRSRSGWDDGAKRRDTSPRACRPQMGFCGGGWMTRAWGPHRMGDDAAD